jgi:AmiR/NasT family two-component response regulator
MKGELGFGSSSGGRARPGSVLTLASHASVAFACAHADTNLQTALVRGTAVGEAIGVAMERHRISATEAFALLAKVSQDRDTEILDVAREVTRTGGFRLGA